MKAARDSPVPCLVCDNPYARFAEIAAWLHPAPPPAAGIHRDASVAADAVVAASAEVGPRAVVGARARIGERAVIGAGTVVGTDVVIGADTRVAPLVSLRDSVAVGQRCIIHSGVVVGADGFGFAQDGGRWIKVPQLGSVVIGDDVEIGANTTIDRGTIENTVIEDGAKLVRGAEGGVDGGPVAGPVAMKGVGLARPLVHAAVDLLDEGSEPDGGHPEAVEVTLLEPLEQSCEVSALEAAQYLAVVLPSQGGIVGGVAVGEAVGEQEVDRGAIPEARRLPDGLDAGWLPLRPPCAAGGGERDEAERGSSACHAAGSSSSRSSTRRVSAAASSSDPPPIASA